jgi:hypothetical protein
MPVPDLKSQFLFTLSATVTQLHDIGSAPAGGRHIDLIGAGKFEGPRLRGELLPGGMDMKTVRADGAMVPNVRLVLRTDDGALIFMRYTGIRHGSPEVMARIAAGEVVAPTEYYLRNSPISRRRLRNTTGSTGSLPWVLDAACPITLSTTCLRSCEE